MTIPAGAAAQAPAAPAAAAGKAQAVVPPWPFPVGVFAEEIQNSYDQTVTMTTAAKAFPDVEIEPDGWARGWWFHFKMVAASNAATVAFAEDFPFCAVNTVLLKGTNVPQTFGPFGGYDWSNINKYGAYQPVGDPRNDQAYNGGTAGSGFTGAEWVLYFPLEISAHDALGDLQNQSDNSVYRVAVTLESSAVVFTTAPTNEPTVELTVEQDSYSEPVAALALGGRPVMNAPPLPGTRQCWQQEDDSAVPAATHTTKITNGIGYDYRNIIFKLMRGGTSRANGETDYPDPLEVWRGGTRVKRLGNQVWKTKMGRRFSFTSTTGDAKDGPENGVRVLSWDQDVNMDPGNEARRTYFRTQDGNVFKVVGTYGHAGTLWITSNYVIPRGGPAANAQIVA
ncbi:MAG: hypothetical protein ACRDNZ_05730 [Streptosporangiaceae bacterium]